MDRRDFIRITTVAGLMAKSLSAGAEQPERITTKEAVGAKHQDAMQKFSKLTGVDKVTIGMLAYPGMFLLDLVGPLAVFESLMNREIHLLWKTKDLVSNEKPEHPNLIPVRPTTTFKDCPDHLDVLFVPGGVPGTFAMMEDPEVLRFLAEKGKMARFVTSVCTGSLVLGAAGLLDGYKATSHWGTLDVLKELGAIPIRSRIVVDRNRITGGGVTAGIDFGLKIAALLRNDTYAEAIQLYLEYDPAPPFDSGSPEKASPEVNRFLNEMFAEMKETARETAIRAKKLL